MKVKSCGEKLNWLDMMFFASSGEGRNCRKTTSCRYHSLGSVRRLLPILLVIERGEEDRRTELPFIDQVAGELAISIDAGFEPRQNDLRGADIKVMRPFRLGD